ncbi:hypothetical protein RFI_04278 [Reticulomyxa filosa]|uniref:DH domain-containing protein n=1 Tax=Reticulomyxa filosa TaxID=46433 RepID=X6P3Y4_RETFI|nr:hypothetical protein RFI_04278 [Reticulomyxa filosa]|eukprot:ETO32838.1 hypothetical protein RFI_04278 [Reticulomyxa filosa]
MSEYSAPPPPPSLPPNPTKAPPRAKPQQQDEEKAIPSSTESENSESTNKPVAKERKVTMEEAIFAFYDSERRYVENLKNGYHHFQHRLAIMAKRNHSILSESDIFTIFGGFQTIGDANQTFLDDLIKLGMCPCIDGIGAQMKRFGHFLKLYSEYIDNVKAGVGALEALKKKNKKLVDFLEVSEELCGRSLQSYLEEPIKRLPTYLQLLADLYTAIIHEGGGSSGESLLEAVDFMKKMIDQVATKSKEKKSRMLCGELQRKLFKNKVDLAKPHRMVYRTSNIRYLEGQGTKDKEGFVILCNDLVILTTLPKKGGKVLSVLPTFELRVVYDTPLPAKANIVDGEHRFAIITQNKKFVPESAEWGFITFFCKSKKQVDSWTSAIESAIDEEEHNLHPTNPIDLMLRLQKKETSPEGKEEQMHIKDPDIIKQIQEWRKAREEGTILPRGFVQTYSIEKEIAHDGNSSSFASSSNSGQSQHTSTHVSAKAVSQYQTQYQSQPPPPSHPPPFSSSSSSSSQPPPPPISGRLPPRDSGLIQKSLILNNYNFKTNKKYTSANSTSVLPKTGAFIPPPPKLTDDSPQMSQTNVPKPPPTGLAPKVPPSNNNKLSVNSASPRNNLLAGIRGFNKSNTLKVVDPTEARRPSVQPEDMQNVLKKSLDKYREFVMDEADGDDDNDEDWMEE